MYVLKGGEAGPGAFLCGEIGCEDVGGDRGRDEELGLELPGTFLGAKSALYLVRDIEERLTLNQL